MARPRKEVDISLIEGLARIGCTDEEIAIITEVSSDTLVRRFAECIKRGRAEMKMSLRRMQIKLAEEGNATMLIWLGKQNLGQHEPKLQIDVNQLDTDIERELAILRTRGETDSTGEAESETIN